MASQLRQKVSNRIDQHLDSYLNTGRHFAKINGDAVDMGLLDPKDVQQVGQFFWKQLQIYNVGYIGFCYKSGDFAGAGRFVQVTPWRDDWGLDWLVVVAVPESDFMAQIDANTRATILLCLGALSVATLLGIYTSRWITHPILKLQQASEAIAKENGYAQEERLANELIAKFYLNWGKEKVTQVYITEAYYCYSRWGAKVKIDDLEKCYPQLLEPILRSKHLTLNPLKKWPLLPIQTARIINLHKYLPGVHLL